MRRTLATQRVETAGPRHMVLELFALRVELQGTNQHNVFVVAIQRAGLVVLILVVASLASPTNDYIIHLL